MASRRGWCTAVGSLGSWFSEFAFCGFFSKFRGGFLKLGILRALLGGLS